MPYLTPTMTEAMAKIDRLEDEVADLKALAERYAKRSSENHAAAMQAGREVASAKQRANELERRIEAFRSALNGLTLD